MNKEGKSCVIYVRVSTEMQVDGYSLDGQKNILNHYAEREGLIIKGIYEDAGKSGKSIEGRPAFTKMIDTLDEMIEKPSRCIRYLESSVFKDKNDPVLG